MTKKHYIALARAFMYARELTESQDALIVIDNLIEDIALICHQENRNFQKDRFYLAAHYRADRDEYQAVTP